MLVKICGVTNYEDAMAAIDGGAGAIGFNFYPRSPRFIDPASLAKWIGNVSGALKVGVFVNERARRVQEIARLLKLDAVQLHGDESPEDCPAGLRVWKARRVNATFDFTELERFPAEAYVLDGPSENLYGGSGTSFDWSVAAHAAKRVIVAGGLDEWNVQQAIERARPWGVDACSRIESEPGKKDHARMRAFLKAALSC